MDVGGLYQTTHEYFSGAEVEVSADDMLEVLTSSSLASFFLTVSSFAPDFVRAKGAALSVLAEGVTGVGVPEATLVKSNAVPGVFGVLVADPNDAKAPEPSPNAEDALVAVGEDILLVDNGAMLLKRPPCELSGPPKRFIPEKVRLVGGLGSL